MDNQKIAQTGKLIEEIIDQSDSLIVNENTATRVPFNRGNNQANPTAPDISIVPTHLVTDTTWETVVKMSSDHLPILGKFAARR